MMTANPASAGRSLDVKSKVSPEEWQVRVDLAACFRLIAFYDMTDLTFTHISARVPGQPGQFLINPFHMMFEEITASSLVKCDMDGKVLGETPYTYNPAGFTIHSAILHGRPDVSCVVHTHSTAGMAVSSLECGLLPLTQTSLRFYGALAYHDYEGVALDHDERPRLVKDLAAHQAMVLRNHGLLTAGRSVPEAFVLMHRLEMSCRAQLQAQQTGEKLVSIPDATKRKTHEQQQRLFRSNVPFGDLEWPSLCRMLDRRDPSYRV
jgi:ribulose-5-phosphate 4-epimerase/fuculose-1-phosphate aldolase